MEYGSLTGLDRVEADAVEPAASAGAARPRHTSVRRVADALRVILTDYLTERSNVPIHSPLRDSLLARVRQAYIEQVNHDLRFNLRQLREYARAVSGRRGRVLQRVAVIADLMRRMEDTRVYLRDTDPFEKSSVEEQCWVALQQFYCDALDLAELLVDYDEGGRPRRRARLAADGTFQRYGMLTIGSYRRLQTLVHVVDGAVPDVFDVRISRTALPTLLHVLSHQLMPWRTLRWQDMERSTLGWLCGEGYARFQGRRGLVVRFEGLRHLPGNPLLFDAATGRVRHNVIVAGSHRIGFLDFPFFAEMLRGVPHGVWANNAFYGGGMGRKMAEDTTAIPVRGEGKLPLNEAIDLTIDGLFRRGKALFLMADGAQPNLLYGNQMRVKSGVRLLADECVRQTAAEGRRTFVVPMTFNDPVAFVRGLSDEIVVSYHPPIEITSASTEQRYTSRLDRSAFNGGDDLLNHLEALYLLNSMQPAYGLSTPPVLAAVRSKRQADRRSGVRSWLKSRFNTAVSDLGRVTGPEAHVVRGDC